MTLEEKQRRARAFSAASEAFGALKDITQKELSEQAGTGLYRHNRLKGGGAVITMQDINLYEKAFPGFAEKYKSELSGSVAAEQTDIDSRLDEIQAELKDITLTFLKENAYLRQKLSEILSYIEKEK